MTNRRLFMTKQVIVTDSTSDLSHEYLKKHDIHVIPLSITIDGNFILIKKTFLLKNILNISRQMQTSKRVNRPSVNL